jgi:hypothetical protein
MAKWCRNYSTYDGNGTTGIRLRERLREGFPVTTVPDNIDSVKDYVYELISQAQRESAYEDMHHILIVPPQFVDVCALEFNGYVKDVKPGDERTICLVEADAKLWVDGELVYH